MKVAFVTIRYGDDVVGGAESFCKIFAEHLSKDWDVDILTTDSNDHFSWKQTYPQGVEQINGVDVHRFPVDKPKDLARLGELSRKFMSAQTLTPQEEMDWINTQGPVSTPMFDYIKKNKNKYDLFFFWGYLFAHTYYGIQLVSKKSILIPFIHDEPPFYFSVYKKVFKSAAGIIFETPEEKELLLKTVPDITKKHEIVGIHVDHPENIPEIELNKKHQIHDPYVTYVGRIEPAKGILDLIEMFLLYKKDYPSKLKLALVGNANNDIPNLDDIVKLGPIFGDKKFGVIHKAKVLINPSAFESFSLVLAESWTCGVPVLVNAKCAVLVGQSERSNGGLWYSNYEEFASMLNLLLENGDLRRQMGINGNKYLQDNYTWEVIENKYNTLANKVIGK